MCWRLQAILPQNPSHLRRPLSRCATGAAAASASGAECYVCGPQGGLMALEPQAAATSAELSPSCQGFSEDDARFRRRCEPFFGCMQEQDGKGRVARSCSNADNAGNNCYRLNNINYCFCEQPRCNAWLSNGPASAAAVSAPAPAPAPASASAAGASPPPDDEDSSIEHSGAGPAPPPTPRRPASSAATPPAGAAAATPGAPPPPHAAAPAAAATRPPLLVLTAGLALLLTRH
ncbi:hypothetical protein R5R35_001501 [Gryllus longicercus]|uniref:Uncharacterized protein n=1 Tax=Gryllus longicercus TaxID=2509291 RepID=A0AAN9VZG0_9ORTH